MVLLRASVAAVAGGLFSASLFFVLSHMISMPPDLGPTVEAKRIEFSRMRRDTQVASKRDEKIERERPPPTPELPRMAVTGGRVENTIAQLSPVVDTRAAMSRMALTAGSDRDTLPLVRIPPDYPPRALSRGLEGWVQVQFTITPTGTVKDAVVVDAQPKGVFDEAALKAIARWRYNPKIEGGVAVERVGIQTIIRFELDQ